MLDQERRKQLRDEIQLKIREEFEKSLPMTKERFKDLFDNLDSALQEEKCNDDLILTI